ncbi:MAG: ATP-binding cassette domain-containing protein [Pseudomonadota bacterium]
MQGVSFDVPVGKCLTLLGASGSGKTTFRRSMGSRPTSYRM